MLQPDLPTSPWKKFGADLFAFDDHQWLIVADYYSKFPIMRKLPKAAPSSVIVSAMKQIFGENGIPMMMISDNGPHFASENFSEFSRSWGFQHVTSSPRYPKSNGFIERQVRTIKSILKKAKQYKTDYDLALLCWRTTPISQKLDSPGQLLMGRRLKSNLPLKRSDTNEMVYNELQKRQDQQKFYHDKHTQEELPPLYSGQQVRVQPPQTGTWQPATIHSKSHEPRSYILETPNGNLIRRNRIHIREIPQVNLKTYEDKTSDILDDTVTPEHTQTPQNNPTDEIPKSDDAKVTRSGRRVKPPNKYGY